MKIESSIHGNKILWRYLDLEKFLDLLINKRLYLTRASILSDQYESTLPLDNDVRLSDYLKKIYPDDELRKSKVHSVRRQVSRTRESAYISSWSLHKDESYALWKIYLNQNRIGVAIKTTSSKLEKSILNCSYDFVDKLFLKPVIYSSYRKFAEIFEDDVNVNRHLLITNKNNFYRFEEEARLFTVVWDATNNFSDITGSGIFIDVNPLILIDKIILSPFVNEWFKPSFEKMISTIMQEISEKIVPSRVSDF